MDAWHEEGPSQEVIRGQRDRFLATRRVEAGQVRAVIHESWLRSAKHGVNPNRIQPRRAEGVPADTNLLFRWLEHAARHSVLQEMHAVSAASGCVVLIADENGVIRLVDGPDRLRHTAEELLQCQEGTCWSEEVVGTNALGTALAVGRPVEVLGAEHFCESAHAWACVAAPILHPVTRRVIGVVDMTGWLETFHPHTRMAVLATAHAIEAMVRLRVERDRHLLLDHFSDTVIRDTTSDWFAVDTSGWVVKGTRDTDELGLNLEMNFKAPWRDERVGEIAGKHGPLRFHYVPCYDGDWLTGGLMRVESIDGWSRGRRIYAHAASGSSRHRAIDQILGESNEMRTAKALAVRYAGNNLPVLIQGETGTGKELFARAIHTEGARRQGPFVAVNCSAIPKELAASEWFGYVGGAFTGASKHGARGKFQSANGGTLFLDEIADMPMKIQPLLLRVLEEHEVTPVGADRAVRVDVRIVAASHQDLRAAVDQGRFREDLYYRLSVLTLRVPPLRRRGEDILVLAQRFAEEAARELGLRVPKMSTRLCEHLMAYPWPGNVRQLKNVMYRMVASAVCDVLDIEHLPDEIRRVDSIDPDQPTRRGTLRQQELRSIVETLEQTEHNVTEAARRLGVSRSTIYRKLQKLQK